MRTSARDCWRSQESGVRSQESGVRSYGMAGRIAPMPMVRANNSAVLAADLTHAIRLRDQRLFLLNSCLLTPDF